MAKKTKASWVPFLGNRMLPTENEFARNMPYATRYYRAEDFYDVLRFLFVKKDNYYWESLASGDQYLMRPWAMAELLTKSEFQAPGVVDGRWGFFEVNHAGWSHYSLAPVGNDS